MKRALLFIGGFAAYWLAPLIPVAVFWDFFVRTDGGTTLSSAVMFVLIIGLPVFRYILKSSKIPFSINALWVLVFLFSVLMLPIIEKLVYVAGAGVIGSIAGSFLMLKAEKIAEDKKREEQENALADKIVERLNGLEKKAN